MGSPVKEYSLDKEYKVVVVVNGSTSIVMSYDNPYLAEHCATVLWKRGGSKIFDSIQVHGREERT